MKIILLAITLVSLMPHAAIAGEETQGHVASMDHGAKIAVVTTLTEPGQSAFAAIQEIVKILDAAPETDWPKVNIEALRQHLIDMNNVTLDARVENVAIADGVKFAVSAKGEVRDSIRRMVMAHASAMNGVGGWGYIAEISGAGANLTVIPPNKASILKLRALDFIGIMALGMHHQQHHLMIAKGEGVHQ